MIQRSIPCFSSFDPSFIYEEETIQKVSRAESPSYISIKLDIELEGKQLKESFIWNRNEPLVSIEEFAKFLAEENNLPNNFENEIINEMRKRINSYKPYKPVIPIEVLRPIKLNVRIRNIVYNDQFL